MSNNNILIGHLGWDGCHFLCACLTMSDKVYFNNFTLRGKTEYFFKGMSNVNEVNEKPVWNDVIMFHGSSYQTEGYVHYRHAWINDLSNNFEQFESDSKSENDFLVSRLHIPIYYSLTNLFKKNISHPVAEMFRSKYFICLVNTHLFASLRGIKLSHDDGAVDSWDEGFAIIPDIRWFNGPLTKIDKITNSITVSEFLSLPNEIQKNIKNHHRSDINDLFNLTKLNKDDNNLLKNLVTHQWDCNWFLNEEETIENIKQLYSKIDLGECDEKLLREMYKVWIHKIDYLKKWHIQDSKSKYVSPVNNDMFFK